MSTSFWHAANVLRLAACACLAALASPARAGDLLAAGDIVALGNVAAPMGGLVPSLVRIDPATGVQTVLVQGVSIYRFIAVDRDETVYGSAGTGMGGRIDRIDLATGTTTVLSQGMNLNLPQGIAIDRAGDLLVPVQRTATMPPSDAVLLRIDAATGAQTVLAANVFLARPKGIALDFDGTAIVVDDALYGGVFRYSPVTGMVTVVSVDQQNSQIVVATHVGIAPGGMIFVNGPANSGLVRIDPVTGAQILSVQSLPNITSIQGSLDGDLFLGWTAAGSGTVVRFDPGTETIAGTVSSLGPLRSIVAMAVVPAPVTPPVTSFCSGDGTATACPCANAGGTGYGCANSVTPYGALLTASGNASVGADTFVLMGSGMPDRSALYFQGTTAHGGGNGTTFGDGLRCAGGTVTRLGTKPNSAGASQYPAAGDPSISVLGSCAAGDFRTYQAWYRNSAPFCTPSTFNLTNGLSVTWIR